MSPSYLAILRAPGVAGAFIPALIGRMSFATVSLGCIVLVSSTTGSYAVAGAAIGALGLANVLLAPWRARFVARRGQRFGLRVLGVGYAAGACALTASASFGAPDAVLVVLAGLSGAAAPPIGAAMRMRWRRLVAEGRLQRAYSLDAVSEELVFVIGPVLAGLLMGATIPQSALLASAAFALVGCFGMTAGDARHERRPSTGGPGGAFSMRIFRTRGFVPVLVATGAAGVVMGAIEVAVPALAAPDETLSGLLLGAMALGSGVGGLVYGARTWPGRPMMRLAALAVAMGALCTGLGLAPVGAPLAAALAITGLALAPTMVTGYLAVDDSVADDDRLEAHTWINTAVNAGAAAASALCGIAIEHLAAASVFLGAGCIAIVLALSTVASGPSAHADG